LPAHGQSSLNRPTRTDDPFLGIFLERLVFGAFAVFGALADEALQDREVPLVTILLIVELGACVGIRPKASSALSSF
jgi:hypothetical protein